MIPLVGPDISRTWCYSKAGHGIISSGSRFFISAARKDKWLFSGEVQKLSHLETDKSIRSDITSNISLRTHDTAEFGHFVARQARLDEEYWTAAWLRAESHWESREHDRYVENYKRTFAEQEFNDMRKRYNPQLGETCKCLVMVREEGINADKTRPKSVIGTLDLSIRHFSHEETFVGERVHKSPIFGLGDGKSMSKYGYISNLCVAKTTRRQGIASKLLEFAILSAKSDGADKVLVHVYRNNVAAWRLYQKLGFEVVDDQFSHNPTYLLCLTASNYS